MVVYARLSSPPPPPELANGEWLYVYRFSAGGDMRGKPWTSEYPTDAQVRNHMVGLPGRVLVMASRMDH